MTEILFVLYNVMCIVSHTNFSCLDFVSVVSSVRCCLRRISCWCYSSDTQCSTAGTPLLSSILSYIVSGHSTHIAISAYTWVPDVAIFGDGCNGLVQGGNIIFFQSLSLLGYCLFPLDVGALICMLKDSVILKMVVVTVTLAWSSWAAYPLMSAAVNPKRKALALYPVFLMYISVACLIIAID